MNNHSNNSKHIAELFYKNNIRNICISPGSRNSEISLSFIKHGKFNCYSILDERSSGYFSIGMALRTKQPSVLICTSGTAVANYFPAIIEASQSRIPIIIITADRPKELLNCGENQTINQKNIYGKFVRKTFDLDINHDFDKTSDDIYNILRFAIGANNTSPGPVHINIHLNDFKNFNLVKNRIKKKEIQKRKLQKPFNWDMIPFEDIFNLYNYKKPLIVIGRLNERLDQRVINQLSKHLNAPILADSLSQMRFSNKSCLGFYDHYINDKKINPDIIIRIGQKPVSKNLCRKLELWKEQTINRMTFSSLLIDPAGRFNDDCPTVIDIHYKEFIKFIIKYVKKNTDKEFFNYIMNLDKKTETILKNDNDWSELLIARTTLLSIDDNEHLFIGNSMPIRYIDMIGKLRNQTIHTYSNRGASGIDGLLSTALGIAQKSDKRTTVLIGDLSFIHDQNSLLIAKQYNISITIVIINNNGGGIFSLLPISKLRSKHIFKKYWTTPQYLNFKKVADLYDAKYYKVISKKQLESALNKCKKISGLNIIDASVNIDENKKILNRLKNKKINL